MVAISRPLFDVEEEQALLHVLRSGQLAQGEQVALFEQAFARLCQVREAVAVSSGTAALQLALLAHEIGPGDEVITSAFSFAATASAILLVGATPVFVDIEPDTLLLDPSLIEMAISPRTKVIMPVHLYGHPCNMQQLVTLAHDHQLAIIEDACQAHGASFAGQPAGSFGTGCFSFYATKNMTTGEGGMVTTNDPTIAEQVRLLRSHGQAERYRHVRLGFNLRMTEFQGALGQVQLRKLAGFNQQRIANAAFYTRQFAEHIQTPTIRPNCVHVFHQYTLRAPEERDRRVDILRARGAGVAIHYPLPIHQQPWYRDHADAYKCVSQQGFSQERDGQWRLPLTEQAAREVFSLPVHPALTETERAYIAQEVLQVCSSN